MGQLRAPRLHSLVRSASDTSAAAALALLADLQTDDGDDAGSRTTLLTLAKRFPSTRFAAPARFDAAMIALILGKTTTAEKESAALSASSPKADALAVDYWLGRSRQSAGDVAGAKCLVVVIGIVSMVQLFALRDTTEL